jgi:hypothetical protein
MMKTKTIYIYQYNGYNGGFARERTLLWTCVLVGANGEKRSGGHWMNEGIGNVDKQYAIDAAKNWSKFLDWPVVDLGRADEFDDVLRR